VCVCVHVFGSGRKVADAGRQHNAYPAQYRHLHRSHRRHLAVVPAHTAGRRRSVPARLRPVPGRYPASPAPPTGINGAAVDAC